MAKEEKKREKDRTDMLCKDIGVEERERVEINVVERLFLFFSV